MSRLSLVRKAGPMDDEAGTHLLTLNIMLLRKLGPEYLTWSFSALKDEVADHWGPPGELTWQKIMAGVVLQSTSIFWREWEVFENITAAINGEYPIFSLVQPPEPEEVATAIYTADLIDRHDFSSEVLRYMVAACLDDGMWYFDGTPLEICQAELQEYDKGLGIQRRYGDVAYALQRNAGKYDSPSNASEVQANKVRDVQEVVLNFSKSVEAQIGAL